MRNPTKNILITGASSGLGAALALGYAKAGRVLYLQGRNSDKLDEIAGKCRNLGADVYTQVGDVTDASAMQNWIENSDMQTPLDLVIANAGISAGMGKNGENSEQVRRIFATNIDGVINTVQPVIPLMLKRGKGQIAIMSSLAGIRALPSSPAYSASKACVRYYGESLRGALAFSGVSVSVICPGYITTPMTAVNNFPMPFIMSAEKAAQRIIMGLEKKRGRIAFPLRLYLPLWLISCLSPRITDPVFSRLPAKPSLE
ncbi:MAG: SDR family NAD(P)-dependent oxidoreductase [Pseudomonadota bacterium]